MSIRDQIVAIIEDHITKDYTAKTNMVAIKAKDIEHIARHIAKQIEYMYDSAYVTKSYFDMTEEERHTLSEEEKRGVR